MRQTFGERIRVAMAVANLNGRDVSRALNVSPMAVSKWSNGKSFPDSRHLIQFCNLTGSSVEWVMEPSRVDIKSTELASRQMEGFVEDLRAVTSRLEWVTENLSAKPGEG